MHSILRDQQVGFPNSRLAAFNFDRNYVDLTRRSGCNLSRLTYRAALTMFVTGKVSSGFVEMRWNVQPGITYTFARWIISCCVPRKRKRDTAGKKDISVLPLAM